MMLLGFEADTLEISLREQLEMVNKIFLVEATANHRGKTKPLLWERLKFSPRFSFIDRAKVEHVVVDDRVMNSGLARVEEWWAEKHKHIKSDIATYRLKRPRGLLNKNH